MFIEDEELRSLYRDASRDHLSALETGLLHLEKHPNDSVRLKALLRATHSLKGDSRMLGVNDAETLTHQMEDLLSAVAQEKRTFTPELCDTLYQGLDAVRQIVHEATTGTPTDISVFHVLAQLMNAADASGPEPALEADRVVLQDVCESDLSMPIKEIDPDLLKVLERRYDQTELDRSPTIPAPREELHQEPLLPLSNAAQVPGPIEEDTISVSHPVPVIEPLVLEEPEPQPSQPEADLIDTVRVEASKLDTLMTQAGELVVTKRRITRRMSDIESLLTLWSKSREILTSWPDFEHPDLQLSADALVSLERIQQLSDTHLEQVGKQLKQLHTNAHEDFAQLNIISNDLERGILQLRQLPFSSMFSVFPRMVRDLAKEQSKTISLVIEGGEVQADKRILEEMKAPLTHLIRNAIDHGIETPGERIAAGKPSTATICLKASQKGNQIELEVIDDGRGLNLNHIRRTAVRRGLHTEADVSKMSETEIQNLIFAPGFSTRTKVTEISGRGVGLDVVRVNVERLKGSIQVQSVPTKGCTFRFTLGTSLGTTSALIMEVNQTPYAIPVEFIDRMIRVNRNDIFTLEGSPTITIEGRPLSVVWLTDLLDLPISVATSTVRSTAQSMVCMILKVGSEHLGVFVDRLIDQQDIVLKPHSKLLKRVRNIAGATILGTGQVCLVLSPQDLLKSAQGPGTEATVVDWAIASSPPTHRVLLVEDSLPIRTQVRRILEGAGYDVTTAVDGLEGLGKLLENTFDAVVSDVEMPNLDGLELTTEIRERPEYNDLPIILVTTLAKDEDKRRGADAGANAYITKGNFDQSLLINTLRRLI